MGGGTSGSAAAAAAGKKSASSARGKKSASAAGALASLALKQAAWNFTRKERAALTLAGTKGCTSLERYHNLRKKLAELRPRVHGNLRYAKASQLRQDLEGGKGVRWDLGTESRFRHSQQGRGRLLKAAAGGKGKGSTAAANGGAKASNAGATASNAGADAGAGSGSNVGAGSYSLCGVL